MPVISDPASWWDRLEGQLPSPPNFVVLFPKLERLTDPPRSKRGCREIGRIRKSRKELLKRGMQRSGGVRRRQEAGGKRIRRKKRRVENQGQLVLLWGGVGGEEKPKQEREGVEGVRQYEDPSPEGILIGREDLRSFLESRGERAAIRIRELLRGLELKGFHQPAPKAGRRPYHPAGLLGLILFGILEGRHSLRQLETLARTDVRCWWITGGIHPDHSVIGRFIQQHEEQLSEGFFIELTRRVLELTKGSGGDLSGDGTIVQAAGSRYRRLSKEAAVDASQLCRFVKGRGRLTTDSLDRIGEVLRLRFVQDGE